MNHLKNVVYIGSVEGFEACSKVLDKHASLRHVDADVQSITDALKTADALLDASMRVQITDDMINAAPNLSIISCATTGSDHIARTVASERNIPILTLRDNPDLLRNITPAAELSWALLMACARKLPAAISHVRSAHWSREQFPGIMLYGKRLGIIGCGRIGEWMSRYALAFGMQVHAYDPHREDMPPGVVSATLDEVMSDSDFISVHVHLSDETRHMVTLDHFSSVKPGAIFINTSRGAVADEKGLLAGLKSGRIGAAGLDVLDGEPNIANHPLVRYAQDHDNLLITPHCGGFSPDAVRIVCDCAARKILNVLKEPNG